MKLELRGLLGSAAFSSCRVLSAPKGAEITGLMISARPGEVPPEGTLLLYCGEPPAVGAEEAFVRGIGKLGFSGLFISPGSPQEAGLIEPCRAAGLIFGTAPPESWAGMISAVRESVASRSDGLIRPLSFVIQELQQAFRGQGTAALLDSLSYWTGCQAALFTGQDTFARPPKPVLPQTLFSPARWQRDNTRAVLPYVEYYKESGTGRGLLRAPLYQNKLPIGVLCLLGGETPFLPVDHILLNAAALLCSGLEDCRERSRRIETAIRRFSEGLPADPETQKLFPPEGYALVLLQEDEKQVTQEQKDYITYLLQHYFQHSLCCSFAEDGHLHLFTESDDIEAFARRLLQRLEEAGQICRAGVSRHYPIEEAAAAFSEAANAAGISHTLKMPDRVTRFEQLGIYRLFNYAELAESADRMLGEMDDRLNKIDKEKRETLAKTIRTFVRCRFNYQQTADLLYTHVNTIRYRLKSIEDLWDVNLSSEDGRLMFSVLAKLLPLWMKSGSYEGPLPDETELLPEKNEK